MTLSLVLSIDKVIKHFAIDLQFKGNEMLIQTMTKSLPTAFVKSISQVTKHFIMIPVVPD